MSRFPILAGAWTVLLVAGFALVIAFGGPTATVANELATALHPAAPVSREAAEAAAAAIVRLQHPTFAGASRMVTKPVDFGIEHWVVEYTDTSGPAPRGLRLSIVVDTGHVEVTTFPEGYRHVPQTRAVTSGARPWSPARVPCAP